MSGFVNLENFNQRCAELDSEKTSWDLLSNKSPIVATEVSNERSDKQNHELIRSTAAIFKHVAEAKNDWRPQIGQIIEGTSFKYHSLKRTRARQCEFIDVDFEAAAASDSDWAGSIFKGCIFDDANFQLTNFSKCHLVPSTKMKTNINGCNFFGATLAGSKLINCDISASTFTSVDFSHAELSDLSVQYSTFESVCFRNATLRQVDLSQSNVEYCDFSNAKLDGLKLSLVQFAYTYGISEKDIINNKVIISSDDEQFKQIDIDLLMSLMPTLINYYQSNNCYFPCANLLLVSRHKLFKAYLEKAITENILNVDLQELKHLCRLAKYSNQFTPIELADIYALIEQRHFDSDPHQKHIWRVHNGDFRHYLLPQASQSNLIIGMTFESKIGANQIENVSQLTQSLSEVLAILGYSLHCDKIEFTKNSPEKAQLNGCTLNHSIINNINAEHVTVNQNVNNATKSKSGKITNALHIVSLVVGILAFTTPIDKIIDDLGATSSQHQQIERCVEEFNKKTTIKAFCVNEGTNNYLKTSSKLPKNPKGQQI